MEKLYTVSKTRLGANCGSDYELLIAKFRLKLKKVRKTTRHFRYDLNQICYDYTVEVGNRLKRPYLIEYMNNDGHDIVKEAVIKITPKKNKYKKAKWLSEEALKIAKKRREAKAKEKRKDIPIRIQSSKE